MRPVRPVVAVIGSPVGHSLSPAIHNAAFQALRLDWAYVAFDVASAALSAAVAGVRALGLAGLSVTMPHKSAIVDLLDRLDPAAATVGAVNTVVVDPETAELVGHNTDGVGLIGALAADFDFSVEGRRCLVLGAGGAGRSAIAALGGAGAAEVGVLSRRPEAGAAAAALAGPRGRGLREPGGEWDLIVNATPLGMNPGDPSPLDSRVTSPGAVVIDLVYGRGQTELIREVTHKGARAADGLGVLIHQAAAAFRLWTGQPAPLDAMYAAVRDSIPGGPEGPGGSR